jgi:hypothetical protein
MNDNEPWLLMHRTAASSIVQTLARHASWQLAAMPADYGLPLAACLYDERSMLLVAKVEGHLASCTAALGDTLRSTRSDGLIVRTTARGIPEMALGLWSGGRVRWHWPLYAWLATNGVLWLAPVRCSDRWDGAFRLTGRRLHAAAVPWDSKHERNAGFARASIDLVGTGFDT